MMAQRDPRQHDPNFLAFVRLRPCCVCHRAGQTQAAHISMASAEHGKRAKGFGEKTHDRWCVPLCAGCHLNDAKAQHRIGEERFWKLHGLDPFQIAAALYARYLEDGGAPPVQRPRTPRKRKPKTGPKRKIAKRINPWGLDKRPIRRW